MLELVPVTLRDARRFIGEHHRHNLPPRGWKFGVGAHEHGVGLVGVGVASRPVARGLDDGYTIEIVRVCTTGADNACSFLYGALCRAAKALGYHGVVTYTLAEESGSSLRAAGFVAEAELEPRAADTSGAQRVRAQHDLFGADRRPAGAKIRWRRSLC